MTFENAIEDWESHDDWRYADRDAERKFFYLAGQASAEKSIENFSLACESYRNRITEQLETIKALNDCIGGKGSCTTDNLVLVGRLEHQIAELEREIARLKGQS